MVTAAQKTLVQESFALVAPIGETAATLFYNRLFEVDPSLRPLFKGDIGAQGKMLMQALALSVKSLDRPDLLVPVLQDLGRRHSKYGVEESHYDTVGGALIWTLEQGLGAHFTNDVRDAWVAVYTLVSTTMKDAARVEVAA